MENSSYHSHTERDGAYRCSPLILDKFLLLLFFRAHCKDSSPDRTSAFQHPPSGLIFDDQYAFRPSGSTAAALIALFHTVSSMLSSNQFIHVFRSTLQKHLTRCVMPHWWAKWRSYRFPTTFTTGRTSVTSPLYSLCRPLLVSRGSESQRNSRLRARSCVVSCHCSLSVSCDGRELHSPI